jgi:hypothetical protein
MDKIARYRAMLQEMVLRHAQRSPSHGHIDTIPVCDVVRDNYLLVDTGWDQTGRVHSIVFHLRICGDRVWVEWDGTEGGIVSELIEAGIPKSDIVLGFYRPERRTLTEFAAA